ncbi:hypothetical protein PPROV_000976500 [Pycnococcus provasolii]|uniref:Uncharacterized protein n=1 Tax=Pycnococcus provasolii TaxID=41880 RepID=A0A830HWF1_9CHLO|nr:hypothetical protein PPROV_000976500 [Pycnococcus provasolii]
MRHTRSARMFASKDSPQRRHVDVEGAGITAGGNKATADARASAELTTASRIKRTTSFAGSLSSPFRIRSRSPGNLVSCSARAEASASSILARADARRSSAFAALTFSAAALSTAVCSADHACLHTVTRPS